MGRKDGNCIEEMLLGLSDDKVAATEQVVDVNFGMSAGHIL